MSQYVMGPDDGRQVTLGALGARFLFDKEGDGTLALVEHPLPARSLGSPIHTHTNEDEYSYVTEGEFGVQIGDEVFTAGPGTLVIKPRGIPHAFWNATDSPARMLEIISPAGFQKYFEELAEAYPKDGPPGPQTSSVSVRSQRSTNYRSISGVCRN